MKIHPVELAELHIKKAPALRRSLLDDPQILRGEEYKVRDAKSSLALRIGTPFTAIPLLLFFFR